MRVYTVIVALLALSYSSAQVLERETCDPSRMQVDIDTDNANAIIGGIFDIRPNSGQGCGVVDSEVILSYEAALWAMRKINQDNFIPGIRLGMQAHDTCSSGALGLSVANNLVPKFSTNSMFCNDTQQIFLGVLGPLISEITKPIARMLSKYQVSMISPGASSPALSDKSMYSTFLRTTISTSEQNKAMLRAMGALAWERVVLVYTDSDYARDSLSEFIRLSDDYDVCVVGAVEVPDTRNINDLRTALTNIEKYNVVGAVYIGGSADFERVMQALDGLPAAANMQWMTTNADVERNPSSQTIRGSAYVQPSYVEVTEFYDYFKTIDPLNPPAENPWFQEWFMNVFQCRLSGINYAPYNALSQCTPKSEAQVLQATNTQYAYVDATVKAVYAFANALRNAQRATCGVSGFCLGLQQMTTETFHNYLSSVDFDFTGTNILSLEGKRVAFDANGDFIEADLMFWNYNNQPSGGFTWKNFGSYDDVGLAIDPNDLFMYDDTRTNFVTPLPSSPCPNGGCQNCLVDRRDVYFSYTPGDLVIAGLFDLHRQGSEVLTCGDLKLSHAVNAAAFKYAIEMAKQNFPNILNGVELGSLIVDLCDNAETGRMFMNNLLGGRKFVRDMYGQIVDPNLIKVTVGELDSTEASAMAVQHGQLGMPYLESSATSVMLSDREMFPTFSRVVPSDYHQMLAIVLMLKQMEWTYIQVVHSNDAYGINGYNVLKREGAKRSICISAVHEYDDAAMVVSNLNNKPQATVIVAIVDTDDFRALLTEVRNQGAQGRFVMIGTETWGRRQSVVAGLESVARGSITLDIDAPPLGNFRSWLQQFSPIDMDTQRAMPFYREWYETSFNCYLDASSRGMYAEPCTNYQPITQASAFAETPYTAFLMSATYASAQAMDMTLREFCGDGYNGICSNFRSNPEVQERLLYHVQNIEFDQAGFEMLIREGEGKPNYAFYSYDSGYTRIGTYETKSEVIQMTQSPLALPVNFQSQCTQTCTECVYLLQTSPYMIIPGPELKIGANFAFTNPDINDPFLCTNPRLTNGIQSGLALHYALQMVNSGNGPVTLNDVQVGSIGMDHCNSPARANGLPSALYSGLLEAPNEPEPRPNLNSIRAWMTDNTLATEEMKDFFQALNLPVISPMAVSNQFLDEDEYPTFLRTVQGDNTIASALTTLAKSLGFSHVTLLYSANDYGRESMDVFKMIAMQDGVCVVKSMEFKQVNAQNIVQQLIGASSHVVVTYLGLADMDAFLQARGNNVDGSNLVVLTPEPYPLVFNRRGFSARNVISLRIKSSGMTGFMNWIGGFTMNDIIEGDSDMLKIYYMELFQCNLPGEYKYPNQCSGQRITDSPDFFQDNYILPIINAVYTFVHAAHETLKAKCGENYSGVCTYFYLDPSTNTLLFEKMQQANFIDPSGARFEFIGREGNIGREIVHFDGNQMNTVADFAGASINFIDRSFVSTFDATLSSCPPPCTECINNMMNFTYIPGDLLLGGIFDVHNNDLLPFSCGTINTLHGFQLLEAFHFAINQVNDKSGMFANILKNVKLGGIGLDACSNAVRAGYLVSNIHSGLTVLQRDGDTIDPDTIEGYIGTYTSGQSIHMARLLKTLEIPQISFGATATSLLNQDRYPYFMRTVPADNRQALAMIAYLQKHNIRYVQILHTTTDYGEEGAAIFRTLAQERQICIAQTVTFQDRVRVTAESANEVILDLLQKPIANTVIVFADTDHINEMLRAVSRNPDAINKFKFIGSDAWANNLEAIAGVENLAEGSVTLDLDVNDLRVFDDYLETKSPSNYPENPWFPEYYEEIQNCYLTIPKLRFPSKCSAATVPVVKSSRYKQDTVIIHVINAVYSAALGLDMALKQECGENYTTVCEAYRNRENRRDLVFEKTLQAEFTDLSGQEFSFADARDGNKGYVLYSLDKANVRGYVYNPIARFSSDEVLDAIDDTYMPSWDGSCNRVDSCTECPTIRNPLTRYMLMPNSNPANAKPATVILTLSVHNQGNDPYRCGAMNMNQFIRGLSYMFAIQNLLPSRKFDLRTLLLDNCNNALRVDQDLFNMLSKGSLCNSKFETNDGSMIDMSSVVGVHTTSSRFVVAANRVTNPYMIQVTSSSASSTAFSETFSYPYFARMVPPDNVQMEAVARILQENDWTYVGVLYSLESYGINGFRALRDVSNEKQYSCVGFAEGIRESSTPDEIRAVVRRLADEAGVGVIVIISVEPRAILQALVDEGLASRYLVIGTDAWGTLGSVTEGLWEHFRGAITVSFRDSYHLDFMDWLTEITYNNRKGIPDSWFEEFYQNIHQCQLRGSTVIQTQYADFCTENMIITTDRIRDFDVGVRDIAAAYALGSGLYEFERRLCDQGDTFEQCMSRVQNSRPVLFGRTLDVDWTINRLDVSPRDEYNVLIGEKRYWNSGYNIYTLKDGNQYEQVGSWSDSFTFNKDLYETYKTDLVSRCPTGKVCDCAFEDGGPAQPIAFKYQSPIEPRNYFMYDEDTGSQTYTWPIWAIAVAVLTCIGLLVGLILFFYFLIAYPVRGGTTALGFMMMIGVFGIYAINFAFFLPASEDTCGARQACLGIVYAIVFAALFVKAVDNWRFKDSEYSTDRYRGFSSPLTLITIAIGIVLVQCIIPAEWLILKNPSASLMDDATNQHDWMWCDPHDFYDLSLVLSMSFVVFLVIVTAVFAALAWDSESNYYESRWIFVSCVCTAGCFLVWMVVTTNAGAPNRDPAIAIANFVNATALLIFIPLRKLVLLIQIQSEEEKLKMMPQDDMNTEVYSTVYTNQVFQSDVFPDSKHGSENGYS